MLKQPPGQGAAQVAWPIPRLQSERYRALVWGLWVLLLLIIPVTSAPQVAVLLGENAVSPLALIPLAAIGLLWFVPYIARGGRLPAVSWPLLAFVALGIISALAAAALPIYP